jgi:hypothetical protein
MQGTSSARRCSVRSREGASTTTAMLATLTCCSPLLQLWVFLLRVVTVLCCESTAATVATSANMMTNEDMVMCNSHLGTDN